MIQLTEEQIELLTPAFKGANGYQGKTSRDKYFNLDEIISDHFSNHTSDDHLCKQSLTIDLSLLGHRSANILETGSSAWGSNSSMLFDSFVNSFGGQFSSVDIRLWPMFNLTEKCTTKSTFYCYDSINFLKKNASQSEKVDLLYLDSWDLI